jgi:pimeloyl-ACP methyl ester carboxylesterase
MVIAAGTMNADIRTKRQIASALCCDPSTGRDWPATTLAHAIPSSDVNLNAVLYAAAGAGLHPTVLLLHGLPGNEQNVDCAQSIRRAGWNVLTIHYRGSWGGPGTFSFGHCLEDAAAALSWLRATGLRGDLRIDPHRIVIIGHSMGGFVAAHTAAAEPEVIGTVLISGVDLGRAFGRGSKGDATNVDDNIGVSAGLHILTGTSPHSLAQEAHTKGECWRLTSYAAHLASRPLLLITSDDGCADDGVALADAVILCGSATVSRAHLADDHSYSNSRIGLQELLLEWLASRCPAPENA